MEEKKGSIEFYLDSRSGVAPYLQLVHQVKHALRLGFLQPGDQLPTMREVVTKLIINPNTVSKAYRTLELEGLVSSRPGLGTFVRQTLTDPSVKDHEEFRQRLMAWFNEAFTAGLNEESVQALFESTFQQFLRENERNGLHDTSSRDRSFKQTLR
jgi:GntR family transcriptional regulator